MKLPLVSLILRLWFIFGTYKMIVGWTGGGGWEAMDSELEAMDHDVSR
jgi:hypothetical protein